MSHQQQFNSNYMNNNNNNSRQLQTHFHKQSLYGSGGSARFARINAKPHPPKSTSYSSFKSGTGTGTGTGSITAASTLNHLGTISSSFRPEIKYTQMSHEQHARLLNEAPDDDNFSLHNFKGDEGITYVPFQSPTPTTIFPHSNHNNNSNNNSNNNMSASYASIISPLTPNNNQNDVPQELLGQLNDHVNNNHNNSSTNLIYCPPNYQPLNNNEILLENGAVLYPAKSNEQQPVFNVATRALQQQSALPYYQRTAPPPPRPTNIPLPSIPNEMHTPCFNTPLSPSDETPPTPPPPPAAARPHIFQPRSGHAPYPDLSPEVTEKYAMPTQYVPRSPVATRIARRQQRQQQERLSQTNNSLHFCDQIRDAPPGYVDTGFSLVRAKSHDRLSVVNEHLASVPQNNGGVVNVDAAPHVNRRSGRRDTRARPRSYCNSLVGGEGVVRGNIAADRELSSKNLK